MLVHLDRKIINPSLERILGFVFLMIAEKIFSLNASHFFIHQINKLAVKIG